MDWNSLVQHVIAAVVFGAVGVALFAVALRVISKVTPFSVTKEIAEDQNIALAIVIASIFLGLAAILCVAIA